MMKMKITMLFIVLFSTGLIYAQNFKGHVSGTYGRVNEKIRLQFELPIDSQVSYGVNMNYYFKNWKGPVVEPFIRVYREKDGNAEGFYGQAKLIYGNLSPLDSIFLGGVMVNERWSTYGVGLGCGNKFLFAKHFTIEYLVGARILSPPPRGDDFYRFGQIGWYLSTGLPIDFQLKVGYQF
jgi:hypothetical protein